MGRSSKGKEKATDVPPAAASSDSDYEPITLSPDAIRRGPRTKVPNVGVVIRDPTDDSSRIRSRRRQNPTKKSRTLEDQPPPSLLCPLHDRPGQTFQRFRTIPDASRFAKDFSSLPVAIERSFELADFDFTSCLTMRRRPLKEPIPSRTYGWIHSREWDPLLTHHSAYPDLVREFYCFARIELPTAETPLTIVSHVRGREIHVSAHSIRDFVPLPRVLDSAYPYSESSKPEDAELMRVLFHRQLHWDSRGQIGTGLLDPDFRLLYHMFHGCFKQSSHHSKLSRDDAYFLYSIGTADPLDIAIFLFDIILAAVRSLQSGSLGSSSLPLGSLLSSFLRRAGVPLIQDERSFTYELGPFDRGCWAKSVSSSRTAPPPPPLIPPVVPAAPPSLDEAWKKRVEDQLATIHQMLQTLLDRQPPAPADPTPPADD